VNYRFLPRSIKLGDGVDPNTPPEPAVDPDIASVQRQSHPESCSWILSGPMFTVPGNVELKN
jgi:hypothetical protein